MDHKEFEHLRKLCRLDFTPEEKTAILESLQKVLDYIDLLDEVNTEGVASCNFVLRSMLKNQMREDVVQDVMPREIFLAGAPNHLAGLISVPPVMKGSV